MSSDDQQTKQPQQPEAKKTPVCTLCSKAHVWSKCTRLSDIKRFWTGAVPTALGKKPLPDPEQKALHCTLCNSIAHNGGKCPLFAYSRDNYATLIKPGADLRAALEADKALHAVLDGHLDTITGPHIRKLAVIKASAEEGDDDKTRGEEEERPKKTKKRKPDGEGDKDAKKKKKQKAVAERDDAPRPQQPPVAPADDDATVYVPPRRSPIRLPCMVAPARDASGAVVGTQTLVHVTDLVCLDELDCKKPSEQVERTASWLTTVAARAPRDERVRMDINLARSRLTLRRADGETKVYDIRLVPVERNNQ